MHHRYKKAAVAVVMLIAISSCIVTSHFLSKRTAQQVISGMALGGITGSAIGVLVGVWFNRPSYTHYIEHTSINYIDTEYHSSSGTAYEGEGLWIGMCLGVCAGGVTGLVHSMYKKDVLS